MGPLDVSRPWETRAVVGVAPVPAAGLAAGRRRADRRASGSPTTPLDDETRAAAAPHHRRRPRRHGGAAVQHGDRQADRADQPGHPVSPAARPREVVEPLVLMLAPFAPHLAEELWQRLGHDESLAYADFPVADPALLVAESVTYPVQVNGKVRGRSRSPADADEDAGAGGGPGRGRRAAGRRDAEQGHRGAGPHGQRRRLSAWR